MQAEATFKMSCSYEHAQKNTRTHTHTHTHTPWHTQTHLPCVSVDWVNQPNFPFFFSVRSASVTPWCYQHAVHTARQQRKQWVSTQQNKRGTYGKRQLQYKLQTQLPCPEKLQLYRIYSHVHLAWETDCRIWAWTMLSSNSKINLLYSARTWRGLASNKKQKLKAQVTDILCKIFANWSIIVLCSRSSQIYRFVSADK